MALLTPREARPRREGQRPSPEAAEAASRAERLLQLPTSFRGNAPSPPAPFPAVETEAPRSGTPRGSEVPAPPQTPWAPHP